MTRRHLPTLAAMECFASAARHLSFTRAAEELHLTQSAVSKQVAQLEALLEHPLFRRVRRRLQLTAEGLLYLAEVHKVLSQVEMSTRYMQSYGGENEVLTVATLPTFGARWLMPRLNGFRFKHPKIYLNITNRPEAFDFSQENIDVAFFYGQGVWPQADCIKLVDETVVPLCSAQQFPEAGPVAASELTKKVLLQMTSRPEQWHDWFAAQNLYSAHSYYGPRFDSYEMALSAARAGCGIALAPRFLAEEEIREGKLIIPCPEPLETAGAYYMVVPHHKYSLEKVRAFKDWVLSHS